MTFNDDAKYSGQGVRKSGRRTGLAVGGGGIGLVAIVLLSQLLGVDLSGLLGGGSTGGSSQSEGTALENCYTGDDADTDVECRVGFTRDSLEAYWAEQAPALGIDYATTTVNLFVDGVDTGCGSATSAVGPFYCPADQQIYLDTAFYDTLRTQFDASAGPLAQLYVVGHEWGHHIQNRAGTFANADLTQSGPTSDAVRLEVQADCFAGAWLGSATETTDADGVPLLDPITDAQIADALNAASAIGDDRIQEKTQGQVNPESWTHGSSEMRQKWFQTGYTGGAEACDTFAVADAEL
ncbi:neutral zinc metallopeptidase [Cryobacterium sp. 1639]|uniref:KPN_02809 family neutral zinc metallopeptidase n=1 Tax=Cryobacterium inferilacus TaxID=2866629 RepID=UPI001C72F0E1|nr:neutral zinc metallopeptidase [Cryobacterium sp. 1639]MBX0300776.1 neutral zinc metallopeptidase [Cryobacterium sp. 1639]